MPEYSEMEPYMLVGARQLKELLGDRYDDLNQQVRNIDPQSVSSENLPVVLVHRADLAELYRQNAMLQEKATESRDKIAELQESGTQLPEQKTELAHKATAWDTLIHSIDEDDVPVLAALQRARESVIQYTQPSQHEHSLATGETLTQQMLESNSERQQAIVESSADAMSVESYSPDISGYQTPPERTPTPDQFVLKLGNLISVHELLKSGKSSLQENEDILKKQKAEMEEETEKLRDSFERLVYTSHNFFSAIAQLFAEGQVPYNRFQENERALRDTLTTIAAGDRPQWFRHLMVGELREMVGRLADMDKLYTNANGQVARSTPAYQSPKAFSVATVNRTVDLQNRMKALLADKAALAEEHAASLKENIALHEALNMKEKAYKVLAQKVEKMEQQEVERKAYEKVHSAKYRKAIKEAQASFQNLADKVANSKRFGPDSDIAKYLAKEATEFREYAGQLDAQEDKN